MSTAIDHRTVAVVYGALAELEGGSHSVDALRLQLDLTEAGEPTDAEIQAALRYLERRGMVVGDGSPGGLLWSLAELER